MSRTVRVALSELRPGERRLEADEAHYLARVHRLGRGDRFIAFDPAARLEAAAEIVGAERATLLCRFAAPEPARVVGEAGLVLIQCTAKGEKLDDVVRAATALGAGSVVIAESARSVARASGRTGRMDRLHAVALDAARQSGRGDLPELDGPRPLGAALAALPADTLRLCLSPEAGLPLARALERRAGRGLHLLVGPEGGLSGEELELARAHGFELVTLGSLVLRTELAGVVALAVARAAAT